MRKNNYLNQLKVKLSSLPSEEAKKILKDIENKFDEGVKAGKTEDEIASELGSPSDYAASCLKKNEIATINSEGTAEPKERKGSKGGAIAFVIIFNIIVGIPVWISLLAFIFGLIGAGLGVGLVTFILSSLAMATAFSAAGILLAITAIFAGIAYVVVLYFLIKYYFVFLISYIKWNAKLIREGF